MERNTEQDNPDSFTVRMERFLRSFRHTASGDSLPIHLTTSYFRYIYTQPRSLTNEFSNDFLLYNGY